MSIVYEPLQTEHIQEVVNLYVKNFWDFPIAFGENNADYWESQFDESGYGVIGFDDEKIACCYWGERQVFLYNQDYLQGAEFLWFMMPEYRTGKNFVKFLDQIEAVNRLKFFDFYQLNVTPDKIKLATNLEKYGFVKDEFKVRKHLNV